MANNPDVTSPRASANPPPVPPKTPRHWSEAFRMFAERTAQLLGTPWAFFLAVGVVLVWALSGPAFHFSAPWQMLINSGTTIITFLMVFLLQGTQARDSKALHLKLNELLRAVQDARTGLVGLEQMSDAQLDKLSEEFTRLGGEERDADDSCPPAPKPAGGGDGAMSREDGDQGSRQA